MIPPIFKPGDVFQRFQMPNSAGVVGKSIRVVSVSGDTSQLEWTDLQPYNAALDTPVSYVSSRAGLLATTGSAQIRWPADEGGEFKLSSDQDSDADNVLRIERTDGTIVERVWDGVNFSVEWVPMNVANSWGTPIVNGDKITAAVQIIPAGATLHLKPKTTYNVDLPARLDKDLTIEGHGATVKRSTQRSSLLTANSNSGSTTVTVANGSAFRVGQRAFVVKTAGVLGGHAMVNGTSVLAGSAGFIIIGISGNVITFGESLQQSCVSGNNLVALDSLLISDDDSTRIVIRDTVFDGDNTNHDDVLDWAAGYGLSLAFGVIERCKFINMPNECLTLSSGSVVDCTAEDCWGSFVHVSANGNYVKGIQIQNCYTKNTTTKNNFHDEGVITFSANTRNIRLLDCVFDNSAGTRGIGVLGLLDSSTSSDFDSNVSIENVVGKNFSKVLTLSNSEAESPSVFDRVHICKCTFDTCGLLSVNGKDVTKSGFVNEFIVSDSAFVNCWCLFAGVRYLRWLNNTYYWDLFDTVYAGTATSNTFATLPTTRIGGTSLVEGDVAGLTATDGSNLAGLYVRTSGVWVYSATMTGKLPTSAEAQPGGLYIKDCGDVEIAGGCINGPGFVANGTFLAGISVLNTKFKKTEAGTSTVAYMELNIHDVSINSWVGGVVMRADAWWAVSVDYDTTNWNFTNTNVSLIRDNVYVNCIGLQVPAGAVARNCTIWFSDKADQTACAGIQLHGPQDATKHVGGAAIGCYVPYIPSFFGVIYGSAIRHGLTSSNANNKNCISVGNVIATAVTLNGTHDSVQDNNTVISLAGMTNAQIPPWRRVGQNENLY